jgi:hypothetical protein
MPIETAVWRRFPVRGPGRFVIPRARARAARTDVIADGPFGARIAVESNHDPELSVYLWGTYQPEVEGALARLLTPGATSVDIGAGTGVISAVMAVLSRPGRVIAVEPAPGAAERIARQAALNGVTIEVLTSDPTRLDEQLPELGREGVDVVRILVGGREPEVLRGARGMLEAARPALIFDWCPEGWRDAGEAPGATAELLEQLGYRLFAPVLQHRPAWSVGPIRLERFEPAALDAFATGSLPGANVVAIPSGRDLSVT